MKRNWTIEGDSDAAALSEALSGLVGAVGGLRWWVGRVVEDYPARTAVPDAGATSSEVARQLRELAAQLEDLPRP